GPSGADIRALFEAPVDWADGYGTRMRGYVTAPVAGAYVFTISGDDECQLWLATSGDPAQKALIASVPGWTSPREWDRYPEQRSAEIHLAAGQRCYIEALHKEGWGGDSLAVAWRFPNGAVEAPIPGHRLTPYSDAPLVGTGTGLAAEYYDGPDFTAHVASRVDAVVDFAWSDGSPHAAVSPDTFSARWRGQVQAMTTGTYAFHVVGDDGVRLRVGGQLIVDAWRDQSPTESTGSIELAAGQRYDLVLEYYENGGGADCHLQWSGPGVAKSVVPSSQLYPSPLVPVPQPPQPPQPPAPDPDPQPVNLVRNPGFELGLGDWLDQGASTTVAGSGIGGSLALRIGTGAGGRVQDLVGVVGGATYSLSAWGRVSHSKERGSVQVEVVGGDGLITTHALPFNAKGWTRKSLNFTVSADARSVRVRVLKAGKGWFFYADDLSVTATQALPSGPG
nr:carbohydrate binding domain-containing protein [Planctomycetota bacterium]